MKVLIINGSPRAGGNTATALAEKEPFEKTDFARQNGKFLFSALNKNLMNSEK